jgi:4-hydroxybenzoate polyprenyltransferase
MQLVFRYGFLALQNIPLALQDWQYALLVLSTVLLAAAGYVINAIFDQSTDTANKPNAVIVGKRISESNAYTLYTVLNTIGVGIGFYLSNVIGKPGFSAVFILIAATLYIYSTSLKQMPLVGNIVVALLLAFSVVIIGVFDLYPVINAANQQQMANLFSILLDFALFAFMINFLREIVKDAEDLEGDASEGMKTLAIILGIHKAAKLVFALSFIPLLCLLVYIKTYFVAYDLWLITLYTFIFVLAPLLYFMIAVWNAKTKKDFQLLSLLLKGILFFGILSVAIITFNIRYNASR